MNIIYCLPLFWTPVLVQLDIQQGNANSQHPRSHADHETLCSALLLFYDHSTLYFQPTLLIHNQAPPLKSCAGTSKSRHDDPFRPLHLISDVLYQQALRSLEDKNLLWKMLMFQSPPHICAPLPRQGSAQLASPERVAWASMLLPQKHWISAVATSAKLTACAGTRKRNGAYWIPCQSSHSPCRDRRTSRLSSRSLLSRLRPTFAGEDLILEATCRHGSNHYIPMYFQ